MTQVTSRPARTPHPLREERAARHEQQPPVKSTSTPPAAPPASGAATGAGAAAAAALSAAAGSAMLMATAIGMLGILAAMPLVGGMQMLGEMLQTLVWMVILWILFRLIRSRLLRLALKLAINPIRMGMILGALGSLGAAGAGHATHRTYHHWSTQRDRASAVMLTSTHLDRSARRTANQARLHMLAERRAAARRERSRMRRALYHANRLVRDGRPIDAFQLVALRETTIDAKRDWSHTFDTRAAAFIQRQAGDGARRGEYRPTLAWLAATAARVPYGSDSWHSTNLAGHRVRAAQTRALNRLTRTVRGYVRTHQYTSASFAIDELAGRVAARGRINSLRQYVQQRQSAYRAELARIEAERQAEAARQAELAALHTAPADDYTYDDSGSDDTDYSGNWCGASRDGDGDGVWCEGQ